MAEDASKLSMKLKIAKRLKQLENLREEEALTPELPSFSRICRICNKGFSSGKALGGHMKMHVQAEKKMAGHQETSGELYNDGGRSGKHVCFSCGKVFPSKKSLFGHMRSHPERPWRGIHPPLAAADRNSSSSTLSDVDSPEFKFDDRIDTAGTTQAPAMDSSKSLLCWSVTAKRGRRSISSATSHSSFSLDDPMYDAVNDLMLLAATRDGDLDCFPTKKTRKTSQAMAPTNWVYGEKDLDRRKNISDEEISEKAQDEKQKMKKKSQKMRLADLDKQEAVAGEAKKTLKPPENKNTYRCSTCSKIFSTHQALGGHRSSHNKWKHVSAIEAQAEAQENERARKILDFDLNKLPSLNEEEEEQQQQQGIKNGDFYGFSFHLN